VSRSWRINHPAYRRRRNSSKVKAPPSASASEVGSGTTTMVPSRLRLSVCQDRPESSDAISSQLQACVLEVRPEHFTPYMRTDVKQFPIQDRLWAWFEVHQKQVIAGTVVAVIAAVVIGFFLWQRGEREVDAAKALSQLTTQSPGTATRADTPDALLRVAGAYPKTRAGARAMLLAGGGFFTEGKYAEAQAQFERFLREYGATPFAGQARLGVAASLEAQGKTDEAIAAYRVLVDRHSNDSAAPQAKFALARLYERQGNLEQARNLFEDLARSDPNSSIGSEAGMRYEELIAKHPELAPAPTPPPGMDSPPGAPSIMLPPTTPAPPTEAPTETPAPAPAPESPQ
jgi:predicted negative regulator of RcsB-dependent stress response